MSFGARCSAAQAGWVCASLELTTLASEVGALLEGGDAGESRPEETNQSGSQDVAALIGDLPQSVYKEDPQLI